MSDDKDKKQLLFSLITGDMYTVLEDEVKNMDQYQVPMKEKPKSNCKKCYGRFYIGKDVIHNLYVMCPKCMPKCLDMKKIKSTIVSSNQDEVQV